MTVAAGVRIGWADLPAHVRDAVEDLLGAPVVAAVSQPGGFSPGTADRVVTVSGARAFVKAVGRVQNPNSVDMHRREARITAALPAAAPVPRLLGVFDDGDWVAIVLDDVEGRHPRTPWERTELDAVVGTLSRLADTLTPAPLSDVPAAADSLAHDLAGWQRLTREPSPDLDPWTAANLPVLRAAAERAATALRGDTLVHLDVRADNLLIRPDGSVVIVDWPWACTGPAWLDTALLSINVRLYGGGADADRLLADLADRTGAEPGDFVDVLAGIAGFFLDAARLPAPPGLPTVRAFQLAQARALLPWLGERLAPAASGT
jgi:aminoglycoside phosphotransferase (APT) family kinase protein